MCLKQNNLEEPSPYISRYSSIFMAVSLKIGIRTPLGILNGFLARSNNLKKKCLLRYWLTLLHYRDLLQYWLILLLYRGVLHCREFITLLERNIIIIIFQDIPLVFMAAILKIGCVHVVYMYINNCYFILQNTTWIIMHSTNIFWYLVWLKCVCIWISHSLHWLLFLNRYYFTAHLFPFRPC